MEKSNVFIITHKSFDIKYPSNYIPIQVGKCNTNVELPYISDDTGDNIAKKNSNYCELTGMYWFWKNYNLKDYVGLVHYRRFFKESFFGNKILTESKICKYMKNYDIILPKKFYFTKTLWNNYFQAGCGKEKDLEVLKNIIKSDYSDFYDSFEKVMNSYSGSYCNMFITDKKLFSEYSKWLFEVLGKLENSIDISDYTKAEARIYGYISELLINVWVDKMKLKVKHVGVINTSYTFKKKIKWNLKMMKGFLVGTYKKIVK